MRTTARRFESKRGEHGTLYLFRVSYRDLDPACPEFSWSTWAYDADHAVEKFSDDGDDGWKILSVRKVRAPVSS
jgi:hypothetical protein